MKNNFYLISFVIYFPTIHKRTLALQHHIIIDKLICSKSAQQRKRPVVLTLKGQVPLSTLPKPNTNKTLIRNHRRHMNVLQQSSLSSVPTRVLTYDKKNN